MNYGSKVLGISGSLLGFKDLSDAPQLRQTQALPLLNSMAHRWAVSWRHQIHAGSWSCGAPQLVFLTIRWKLSKVIGDIPNQSRSSKYIQVIYAVYAHDNGQSILKQLLKPMICLGIAGINHFEKHRTPGFFSTWTLKGRPQIYGIIWYRGSSQVT